MIAIGKMRSLRDLEGFGDLFVDFYNKGRIVWGFC
jgi:hypothetical protein